MAENKRIDWDQEEQRLYETGVDRGVLYPRGTDGTYETGVPWSGLSNVTEKPSGAESTSVYADNIEYLSLQSVEKFGCTIEAYTYPDEFAECDGSKEIVPGVYVGQQTRKRFGFVYRTLIGNPAEGTDYGYKIHFVYNASASPSEKSNGTVNESPEAATMSWECSTIAEVLEGMKPTAHVTIVSTKVSKETLEKIEKIIYGSEEAASRLPTLKELVEILKSDASSYKASGSGVAVRTTASKDNAN